MTIVTPSAPTRVGRTLRRNLRNLAKASVSAVPSSEVWIAPGMAIYRASPPPLSEIESKPIGWRHIVLTGESAIWADVSRDGFEGIFSGPQVIELVRAAKQAEASCAEGEARILVAPLIEGGALWIAGESDHFWQFSPEEVDQHMDEATLLGSWRARAETMARQSDALD